MNNMTDMKISVVKTRTATLFSNQCHVKVLYLEENCYYYFFIILCNIWIGLHDKQEFKDLHHFLRLLSNSRWINWLIYLKAWMSKWHPHIRTTCSNPYNDYNLICSFNESKLMNVPMWMAETKKKWSLLINTANSSSSFLKKH